MKTFRDVFFWIAGLPAVIAWVAAGLAWLLGPRLIEYGSHADSWLWAMYGGIGYYAAWIVGACTYPLVSSVRTHWLAH